MIHPDTELRHVNDQIGCGVFATRPIPKGTIVWARDELDQTFAPERVAQMGAEYKAILEKYSFVDARGQYVLCWDHSRFFNHSCEANCLSGGYDFELAVRDIRAGEELTDDYGTLNLRERFRCACGAHGCREWVLPDDMERWAAVWDAKVREAFPLIDRVAQPLWMLIQEKAAIIAALREIRLLRSVRMNYAPLRSEPQPPPRPSDLADVESVHAGARQIRWIESRRVEPLEPASLATHVVTPETARLLDAAGKATHDPRSDRNGEANGEHCAPVNGSPPAV